MKIIVEVREGEVLVGDEEGLDIARAEYKHIDKDDMYCFLLGHITSALSEIKAMDQAQGRGELRWPGTGSRERCV